MSGEASSEPTGRRRGASGGRDDLQFLIDLSLRKGDLVRYRSAGSPGVLLGHPALVRHVLVDAADGYTKATAANSTFASVVANGVLTAEGEAWRRRRRLLEPAFRTGRIEAMDELVVRLARGAVDRLSGCRPATPVDLGAEMRSLTLEITTQALFGFDVGGRSRPAVDAVAAAMTTWTSGRGDQFDVAERCVRRLAGDILGRHRRRESSPAGVLHWLTTRWRGGPEPLTDDEVTDEIVTLLLAGHETTANALTWTFVLLSEHPDVAESVARELQAVQGRRPLDARAVSELPLLQAVISEALRLYPPSWIIGRRAARPDCLAGAIGIEPGTVVAISPYVLHRHPRYWHEPGRFDPGRFSRCRTGRRPAGTYLPFGLGPRHCLGHRLAMLELQLIVGTVVQAGHLAVLPGHAVTPERLYVLRPRGPVPATIHLRSR